MSNIINSHITRPTLIAAVVAVSVGGALITTAGYATSDSSRYETSVEYNAYRSEQSTYKLRASDVIGAEVMNADDEEIGEVDDLVLERDGGQIVAVISVGGFLGIGDKLVSVPYDELRISEDGDEVYLSTTKEDLEAQPEFNYLEGEAFGRDRMATRSERLAAKSETMAEETGDAIAAGWAKVKSEWSELKAGAKQQWDKLTDEDLETIEGDREKLVDHVGERYEKERAEAEREADEWVQTL